MGVAIGASGDAPKRSSPRPPTPPRPPASGGGVVPFETAAGLTADALQRLVDWQLTGNSALC